MFKEYCDMSPKMKQILANRTSTLKCKEYIVSFSRKFINKLYPMILDGYNGHSEITAPMLCQMLKLKHLSIDKQFYSQIFSPYHSDQNGAANYVNQLRLNHHSKLVHPCKF